MNWALLQPFPWVDTRARFVAGTPRSGSLLDIGSSDGETLNHIAELRPDLRLFATDLEGCPDRYPAGCTFFRGNLETDRLPWPDGSMDAITCMHLVEHLKDLTLLLGECARLLKRGGRVYFETPHPRTVHYPSLKGNGPVTFTLNFYDDPTHVRPVPAEELAQRTAALGLKVVAKGISRNWLFAAAYPLLMLAPASRKKYTSRVHWLGWSAYVIALRPS